MLAGVSRLDMQGVGRSEYPAAKLLEKKKKNLQNCEEKLLLWLNSFQTSLPVGSAGNAKETGVFSNNIFFLVQGNGYL